MRPALFLVLFLSSAPIVAADTKPEPPPSPPPVVWEVWGFRWDGSQYVKEPTHCLKTTNLQQAADYSHEIVSFNGWVPTSNLPLNCYVHHTYTHHNTTDDSPTDCPPRAVFDVWAFKLTDGKWLKSDEYSWSTRGRDQWDDRLVALDLVKRINAVPGWCATTNAPDREVPPEQREVYMGNARGDYHIGAGGGYIGQSRNGYPVYSEHGGRTIYRPHMTIRLGADANAANDNSSSMPTYDPNLDSNNTPVYTPPPPPIEIPIPFDPGSGFNW
jgi:hypothetical protein